MTSIIAVRPWKKHPLCWVADLLSAGNLACGAASIYLAMQQQFAWCLVLLGLGALFDGLDGAAARRWGGSRFGVFADDLADGVSYGVAPAVAIFSALGGVQGVLLGVAFAVFVVARLVFFALSKGKADPRYFSGVPSTIGGLIVLCSLLLFGTAPALVGFMIGVACAQMVAFSNPHRHLGRFLSEHPLAFRVAPLVVIAIVATGLFRGPSVAASLVLTVSAGYALWPTVKRFYQVLVPSSREPSSREPSSPTLLPGGEGS